MRPRENGPHAGLSCGMSMVTRMTSWYGEAEPRARDSTGPEGCRNHLISRSPLREFARWRGVASSHHAVVVSTETLPRFPGQCGRGVRESCDERDARSSDREPTLRRVGLAPGPRRACPGTGRPGGTRAVGLLRSLPISWAPVRGAFVARTPSSHAGTCGPRRDYSSKPVGFHTKDTHKRTHKR